MALHNWTQYPGGTELSRRSFTHHAAVLGAGLPIAGLLAHTGLQPTMAADRAKAPDAGTDAQTRGTGKELRVLLMTAPTSAVPHTAMSSADVIAAAPVLEPLMHLLPDGTLLPNLITSVPTVENGGLTADYTQATFDFLPDLTWSDGEPVTADDLVFTWQWILQPNNQTVTFTVWNRIANIEATDDHTAVVTFKEPLLDWFTPFTGTTYGCLYPAHVFDNDPSSRNDSFPTAPVGTGPYVITGFSQAGEVTYEINDTYRDPAKPYFSSLTITPANDPEAAVRSVVEAGESDIAWGVQLDPSVIADLASGDRGNLLSTPESYAESIRFNFSDPRQTVNGQKSEKDTPHPVFGDPAVRRALALAVNRGQIVAKLYGAGGHTTANVLLGLDAYTSGNTGWEYNLDKANQLLDDAGWERDGDTRSKDGVALAFDLVIAESPTRQAIVEQVQADFARIGVAVQLQQLAATDFFGYTADDEQSFYHMYWDAGLWADGTFEAFPLSYMRHWYAGPDGENISQRENDWLGEREVFEGVLANTQRYTNPDYDALYEKLEQTLDQDEAFQLLVRMNELLVADAVEIPVVRHATLYALATRVRPENIAPSPFNTPLWNIANWNETDDLLG